MKNFAPGFFLVGPTAVGKTEIAIEVAQNCGAEIISADAFQIYCGLDLLTAKPSAEQRARVPHHLIGEVPLTEEMNVEKFRRLALQARKGIRALIVGGNGLYVNALINGLSPLPKADAKLRERLTQFSEAELLVRLQRLDPETAAVIDGQNKRRLLRAVEICLLSGRPASAQRQRKAETTAHGIFLFRERDELYERINRRVEKMFADGVVEEVRALEKISATAEQTLGLREIREMIVGKISQAECVARIQQATRRYAKRQLTWFRHQTKFEALNLTCHKPAEAIELITRKARLCFAQQLSND